MGRSHWLPLDAFSPGLLIDNLLAAQDYFLRLSAIDPSACYPVYVMNYMPPSAGSIVHPHAQLWLEREPLPRFGELLERSQAHFQGGTSYWEALVERERQEGERFIGENEAVAIMTSFAPRGSREVLFVFKRPCPFTELNRREIDHFCQALSAVLRGYHAIGVGSFNLASFSSAVGETLPYFPVQFRLISRPYPRGTYTNDTGPLERFFGVSVVDDLPEEVAASLRPYFAGTYQRGAS
jgi:galactose-1-phosphate uridylyltransferase